MKFDNKTIKGGEFQPLGPGIYGVRVWEHRFREVNNKDVVDFMFKTELGETHWETFWLTDAAQFRLKLLSVACGINADAEWEPTDLLGKDLTITLSKRTYKGKESVVINRFDPPMAGGVQMPDHNPEEQTNEPETGGESLPDDPF